MQDPWYAIPSVWVFALTAIAFSGFSLLLSLRWRGEVRSAMLLAGMVFSALWAVSAASFEAGGSLSMWRTSTVFDAIRTAALLGFLLLLIRGGNAAHRRRPGRVVALLIAALTLVALFVPFPPPGIDGGSPGELKVALGGMLCTSIVGLVLVEEVFRRVSASLRWNVMPLCLGLGSLFAYDLVMFADAMLFRTVDDDLWIARGVAQSMVIPLLALAAARNREWTFEVSLSRNVVVGSFAVAAAAIYLLVMAAIGYRVKVFGGEWGATVAAVLVFGALVMLAFVVASSTFRSALRVVIAKNLLAHRYDYREEWIKFTRLVDARSGEQSLHVGCLCALGELVETASGALWLRRQGQYVQVCRLSLPAVDEPVPANDELPAFLRSTAWVIDVEEAGRDPSRYQGLVLPPWLAKSTGARLVVPLLASDDDLVGFAVLGPSRVSLTLDWELLDLLKTAARQTAGYLAQQQATEALLEARKFESFNRMSAFVVHDLKNLVSQLQLMLKNAERHRANPDFQRDMFATVGHVVGRMNQLLLQLRSGEEPVDRAGPVDLALVARRVQSVRAAGGWALHLDAADGIMAIGHEDRLERVVGHLVQNAFEASPPGASVTMLIKRIGPNVLLDVSDSGAGMSKEFIRDQLFKPFSTTKPTGMGIGTYESQQYVQSVGGWIEVSSAVGVGTRFRVVLKAVDAAVPAAEVVA